jgi:hypothetical protein
MHNARVHGLEEHSSILLTYWTFCCAINRVHKWYINLTFILGATIYLPIPILLSSVLLKWKYGYIILSILCWAALFVGSMVSLFLPSLTPNPGFPLSLNTIRICKSFQAQVVESLCTRNATDPKDMSFGIHSILEKLGSSEKLSPVDYSLPCAQIYTNLTQYLLFEGDSLLPLGLAARKRCEGAPSWVPDYSQVFSIFSILEHDNLQLRSRSRDNKAYFPYRRLHPNNASILIVKGYMFAIVTQVLRSSDKFQTSPLSTRWPATNVRVGDQIAFISGLPFSIVVRRKEGGLVELIGPAFFRDNNIIKSRSFVVWERHVKERKKKWFETQRSRLPLGSVIEDNPEQYLDDLYIS